MNKSESDSFHFGAMTIWGGVLAVAGYWGFAALSWSFAAAWAFDVWMKGQTK